MSPVLLALIPDFALIVLGVVMRRQLAAAVWQGIDRLNYLLLFPALVFLATLGRVPTTADLLLIGPGVWAIMGLGLTLAWLARPLGPDRFLDFAGMWQCSWRFNTALGFVCIQGFPDEYRAILSIAIGLAVPVANILAVAGLSRGNAMSFGHTVKQILLNPFFLASFLGISLSIAGLRPPDLVLAPLDRLSDAALPIAMISIGAALRLEALAKLDLFKLAINVIRLVILPTVTFAVTGLIGMDTPYRTVLVIFAALPSASAAHVLASVFGADREAVATVIAQTTFLGCATLPFWLMMLGG
ncbi:AEC family transporter [Pseudooceanicola onchidii]|uniref:AEC family transporter n=1 Tax=Pseudooceanicola onchidii TaxID=2562279 RepID=UPI001F0D456B|nr:AEC family transporter [Pseudooceanicola onchidii]